MAPKMNAGYTGDVEKSELEQMDELIAQFTALGLDSFMGDIAASSSDSIRDLLPKMIDCQEKMLEKARAMSKELKLREKDINAANAKARAKARAEEKKAETAAERNKVLNIVVDILGHQVNVNLQGSCTIGELRRLIVQVFNTTGVGNIPKKDIKKMEVKMGDLVLSDRPRATLNKIGVKTNCRLEALIDDEDFDDDDDEEDDAEA